MLLKEVVLQAMSALVTHRFRAMMTMFGIAWGIVTVVVLMAYGNGFRTALVNGFRNAFSDGTGVIYNGQTSLQAGGERSGRRIWLKEEDAGAIGQLGLVKHTSPEYLQSLPVAYGNRQMTAGVRGVAPEYALMRHEVPATGRFINNEDLSQRRRVAFVGDEVARRLFSNIPAVGETIRIRGMSFEVVGVLAQKAQLSSYFYQDSYSVFIPYTVSRQVWSQDYVNYVVFETVQPGAQPRAVKQIRELLAERHRFDPRDERAIGIRGSDMIASIVDGMANGLKVILVFIGVLTLTIGGIGVMNIMLVSVTERTREIGVRKAIGARRRQILVQFLLEALAVTFTGGALGMVLSWVLVKLVPSQPFLADLINDPSGETDIHLLLSPDVLLTATVVLVFTGIVSGLWPAVRASRLDPIEALRYE
jgi:putative ABC transport system permease protein